MNSFAQYIKCISIRLYRATKLWLETDGGVFSAAVAFYAALSAFPAFLIINTAVRLTLSTLSIDTNLDQPTLDAIESESSTQLRNAVEQTVAAPNELHHVGGVLGVVWLFFMALLVFAQIDRGFKRMWATGAEKPASLFSRAISLLMSRTRAVFFLFGLGMITSCVFILHVASTSISHALEIPAPVMLIINSSIHIVVHTAFFSIVFKSFTPMSVRLIESFKAALVFAVFMEIGRLVVAEIIKRDYSNLYGISGSFIIVLLWIYYTSTLIFFSAAYQRVLVSERENASLPTANSNNISDVNQ